MTLHTLPHLTIETGPNPQATVIWLHGLGADGHDFEPIVTQLGIADNLSVRFIFPHAPSIPVTLNGGYIMPAWYDIKQNDLGIEHDHAGILNSARCIQMLIEQEEMRGIPANQIILAGFSQGAAMALHIGLRQPETLAGIIVLSGYLLLPDQTDQFTPATNTTPLFMAHGVHDPIVPFTLGDNTRRTLASLGYTIQWHSYPMEHNVCPEEIHHIGAWINTVFSD
ncbi:MAG: dienelactone hydrolase family protein [Mariprofundus sp.]|nr:dienelactone hydrolase family protein [Mariprofundus sp.]